ncbi:MULTISPECIES: trans-aconitate 2-methyltransferase [Actinosynnema]|uniref:trans-aconitate 2-methyltransferase n=1 Tax=Actinosynnema TaxID=40566 RepID=UPI0020A517A5|nr:trans-aconitate 2-methyltransferase [Actinosynnema pretiosum]MCP2093072.1 trans-aconitate 2-methyltransferase [Actinosynnema pretiosum]
MWDPEKYLAFADHRARPFHELLARVGAESPDRVVDLGCGPGNLTTTLAKRWPGAAVEALDSSPEMVEQARARGLDARVADVADWSPTPDVGVVVTNAVLQWVPGHPDLLRRWVGELASGAWLAVQVPGNFTGPSHELVREVAEDWPELRGVLRFAPVLDPIGYAEVLAGAGAEVDAWETTYAQVLTGEDAALEWISGTALRPVRATLSDEAWAEYVARLRPRLRAAYPRRADGTTWFPFRRVFAVARVR